ncbi:testis-expressed protein 9-like [Actinia tenebrosa]|uniref:Testis-expressed protein 9-like n=1 Tax=Actinia tenebrosa TaxID=6105 RepID=A0A6P8HPV4_ACTTE|nr:testis-expressed protein 9-like [Actinia tenebrosa]
MASSRPTSGFSGDGGRRSGSNNRPPSGKKQNVTQQLLSKEEEYMRLNAEIEQKTASLIKEAEEVMQDQDKLLTRPATITDLSGSADLEDFLSLSIGASIPMSKPGSTTPNQSRPVSKNKKRPKSKTGVDNRPKSGAPRSKSAQKPSANNVVVDDILAERINLATKISSLEDEAKDESFITTTSYADDGILPTGAEDMGSEATIRFLKAKLHVMQEEMDRLSSECSNKDDQLGSLQGQVKELTEEQSRLQKTNTSLQSQIEKHKKLYAESKSKNDSLEQLLSSTKKELDSIQREQKQFVSNKNATEVRLNRALEEIDKYKTALHKAKTSSKDSSDQDRRRLDQILAESKRLEKQKNELMTGFKKQMKLIDILKRQKMHIEAAKLLQFSEEEFVKALDWGN